MSRLDMVLLKYGRKPENVIILDDHRETFRVWLRRQRRRDDAVGDMARDVFRDPQFPRRARTFEQIRYYLTRCDACPGAHKALRRAWHEYRGGA